VKNYFSKGVFRQVFPQIEAFAQIWGKKIKTIVKITVLSPKSNFISGSI
jgi:hypothetical protein